MPRGVAPILTRLCGYAENGQRCLHGNTIRAVGVASL